MMNTIYGEVNEGSDPYILARVVAADGTALTHAQMTNYDLQVYRLNSATPGTAVYSSLAQTGAILVALTTTLGWRRDTTGGNFFQQVANANFSGKGGDSLRFLWTIRTSVWGTVLVEAIVGVRHKKG